MQGDIKLGDNVFISPSSYFYGLYNNPVDCTGEVVSVDNDETFPLKVNWFNGIENFYNFEDLILAPQTKEELRVYKMVYPQVKWSNYEL